MNQTLTYIFVLSILLSGCAPKPLPIETPPPPPENQVEVKERLTDCTTFADLNYADRDAAETEQSDVCTDQISGAGHRGGSDFARYQSSGLSGQTQQNLYANR